MGRPAEEGGSCATQTQGETGAKGSGADWLILQDSFTLKCDKMVFKAALGNFLKQQQEFEEFELHYPESPTSHGENKK